MSNLRGMNMGNNEMTNGNIEFGKNEIITIRNLKKVFTNGKVSNTALHDINLSITQGEIFGIIGLSGAGKSTLVRMMNYLEKPTEGHVYFEGIDIGLLNAEKLRTLRKKITMIFQGFNLLEQKSVIKNVLFPLEISGVPKDKAIMKAKEMLNLVDLENKANEFPSKLSGGQKQRVAIARALATNPKVLLCDEATSALDPKTTAQILKLLKKINAELGVTVVIITHQMNVINSICDRVAIIDGGTIVESGLVKEVFAAPKTEIGKRLIFGATENEDSDFVNSEGKPCLRLSFDGTQFNAPIISEMVIKTGVYINILFANTKVVNDDNVLGQLVIELPQGEQEQNKIKEFLKNKNIEFCEV